MAATVHADVDVDPVERLIDPQGWEPATFILSCSADRKHRDWGSNGRWHSRTYTAAPDHPNCPARGCGQRFGPIVAQYGPNRPSVVENHGAR